MDWEKVKTEYVTTRISLRKLAAKHGISVSTILKRSRRDGWAESRNQARRKIESKVEERSINARAARIERLMETSDQVLEMIERTIRDRKILDPQSIRCLTGALKDVRDVQGLNKSDLDLREQEARIARLQRETDTLAAGGVVTVRFDGGEQAWLE